MTDEEKKLADQRAYMKNYMREYRKKLTPEQKEKRRQSQKKWVENNPEKFKAAQERYYRKRLGLDQEEEKEN